jgi:hypothetical protein
LSDFRIWSAIELSGTVRVSPFFGKVILDSDGAAAGTIPIVKVISLQDFDPQVGMPPPHTPASANEAAQRRS